MKARERYSLIFKQSSGYMLTWIVSFGLIMLMGRILSPYVSKIQSIPLITVVLNVSALLTVGLAVGIVAGGFRISHLANYSKRALLISLAAAAVFFILTAFLVRSKPDSTWLIMLNGMGLIIISFSVGELLSREVLHSGHLIPTVLVLALVDSWSVSKGLSGQIAHKVTEFANKGGYSGTTPPPWSSFLLLRYPQIAAKEIYSFIGVGDLVIIAFFIGCIYRFKLPPVISLFALVGGAVLAVLVANTINKPIPALPVIATLFLLVNIRRLSMKKNDIVISAIVLAIIIIVILFLSLKR